MKSEKNGINDPDTKERKKEDTDIPDADDSLEEEKVFPEKELGNKSNNFGGGGSGESHIKDPGSFKNKGDGHMRERADSGEIVEGGGKCETAVNRSTGTVSTSKDPGDKDIDENLKEKSKKPDKKDQEIVLLKDKYLRLFAEFDNFRKRNEAEKSAMFAEGEKTVILRILPLLDNFERALDTIPDADSEVAFVNGIKKVYKAFKDELTNLGVTPIESVGNKFDSSLHNAVMHVEDEDAGESIVTEEFQKGYMFKDKVLRYAMVKVAN